MTISPQQVQKLREKSGAGLMDCKRALEQSGGDIEKSIQFLREKGKMSAGQKAGRSTRQGLVCARVSPDSKKGGLVELNCESDFVARTSEFQNFAQTLVQLVIENQIKSSEALMAHPFQNSGETVESQLKEKIGKLGENILIKKAAFLGNGGSTLVDTYIHAPFENAPDCGTLGVLLEMKSSSALPEIKDLLKELCLQVAAAPPKWVSKENIPPEIIQKEMEIYKEQCRQMGKPEKAWEKIIEGKFKDFLRMACLLEQPHIRDSSGKSMVHELIRSTAEKTQTHITVQNFVRFKIGEE